MQLLLQPANEVCEGYVFTPVCQSFCSQGVCLSACWDTPLGPGTPLDQEPPWTRHPLGTDIPQSRHPRDQTPPRPGTPQSRCPPEQTPPPTGPDTPQTRYPPSKHPPEQTPPPEQCMLGDTVNKRAVCILLECNLVTINCTREDNILATAVQPGINVRDGFTDGRIGDLDKTGFIRLTVRFAPGFGFTVFLFLCR